MPAYPPACLPTYLPSCLPAFLHNHLPTCLPAYLPTCLPTCLPAFLPACLPAFLHNHLLNYLPTCLPAYLPAYLHICLPACLACLLACLPICLPASRVCTSITGQKSVVLHPPSGLLICFKAFKARITDMVVQKKLYCYCWETGLTCGDKMVKCGGGRSCPARLWVCENRLELNKPSMNVQRFFEAQAKSASQWFCEDCEVARKA